MSQGTSADGGNWNMRQTHFGNGFSTYSGTDSDGNFVSGTRGLLGCN